MQPLLCMLPFCFCNVNLVQGYNSVLISVFWIFWLFRFICIWILPSLMSEIAHITTIYLFNLSVFQLVCLFLSSPETLHSVLHHLKHQQTRIVHYCVQCWMWVMWLSPGTKETVYCPASVCLISASVSLYLWRWNIRIKTPTAVCSTIPSATRPHIWTSLNSVTHVQVVFSSDLSFNETIRPK